MNQEYLTRYSCDTLYMLLSLSLHIPNLPLDIRSDCSALIGKLIDYVSDGYSIRFTDNGGNLDIDVGKP